MAYPLCAILGEFNIGLLFIPLFILVMDIFLWAVVDGIDGLSGGILSIVFHRLPTPIHRRDRDFCGVILAPCWHLWFAFPSAFYLGETGIMGLVYWQLLRFS